VGDAEIIPLGTHGRPGRGTGNDRPSSSARSLAGATPKAAPRKPGPVEEPAEEPLETVADPAMEPPRPRAPSDESSRLQEATTPPGAEDDVPPRTDSGPAGAADGGIPAEDWVAAFRLAARELFGDDWEQRLEEFLAFLRRRLSGHYEVDEFGFDREVTERFFLAAVRPIAEKWFRVEVRGAENIPAEGGALVVSNHSGTIPVDGLVTMTMVHDHTGRHLRPLGADLVFRLPIIGELARKGGATLACHEDAQRMLSAGELVGVWPEGFKGIGKPYSERYKLQRFGRGGFVSAAMRTGVPIVPCSVVGAEEIYPLVGNMPALARLLGVPYIPITPFFPWLGLLGLVPLPSKWLIEFGEPIRTDSYDEGAADDPMLVFNVTDQVRETIQQTLYRLLMQRTSVFY
jgi:1-acyl-sn-glycerol-3-phosphate acyltransferase